MSLSIRNRLLVSLRWVILPPPLDCRGDGVRDIIPPIHPYDCERPFPPLLDLDSLIPSPGTAQPTEYLNSKISLQFYKGQLVIL